MTSNVTVLLTIEMAGKLQQGFVFNPQKLNKVLLQQRLLCLDEYVR